MEKIRQLFEFVVRSTFGRSQNEPTLPFLPRSAYFNPAYFDDPNYVADIMLLGKVYSTSTTAKPWVPIALLLDGFRQVGGSETQFEAALRYALAEDWLVLDEAGTAVDFGRTGFELYS